MTERVPLDHLNSDQLDELHDRLEAAEAAIARVRAKHTHVAITDDCYECSKNDYPDYSVPWPCDTIRALDEPAKD